MPGSEPEAPTDEDEETTQHEVRQRLVQERRMERRARGIAERDLADVDPQRPRQRCRTAEQFLVEVVADPADGLRERERRRRAVERDGDGHALTADHPDADADAGEQATGNAETSLPQFGNVAEMILELRPVGGDVIQPRTDHAGDHGPHGDRVRVVTRTDAPLFESTAHQPHPRDDPESDHQAVGVDLQRADGERATGRTGDTCEEAGSTKHHAVTRFANATDSAKMMSLS